MSILAVGSLSKSKLSIFVPNDLIRLFSTFGLFKSTLQQHGQLLIPPQVLFAAATTSTTTITTAAAAAAAAAAAIADDIS